MTDYGCAEPDWAFDDDKIVDMPKFSVGYDFLYVTVQEAESDIWVIDVEVGR